MDEHKKRLVISSLVAALVASVVLALVYFQKVDFVINNVPPITIYNHIGDNSYILTSGAAALASVVKYYDATISAEELEKINSEFFPSNKSAYEYDLSDIGNIARKFGYDARIEQISTISDLKKYINQDSKTPLIFPHLLRVGQPRNLGFEPFGVLIGIIESEKVVVAHDFIWGYNKKISYDDFDKLMTSSTRLFLIITPKNGADVQLVATSTTPLQRTASMDKSEFLIIKITVARIANNFGGFGNSKAAYGLLKAVVKHEDFESVPPYYKAVAYSELAKDYVRVDKDYDNALKYANLGIEVDHDLDQPFSDFWPGFTTGQNNIPNRYGGSHAALGEVYMFKKQYDQAIKAYEKAIEISGEKNSGYYKTSMINAEALKKSQNK